jgi:squalene-associated FAD-dependent desaturase
LNEASRRVAVVGGGWAGLAAAVRAVEGGWQVTLYEMAREFGGRARAVVQHGLPLDNGQHILIGAYRETLALMRTVGVDPERVLLRRPLALVDATGRGLRLPSGPALPAFVRAVWSLSDWPRHERLALLMAALRWRLAGFRADPRLTVAELIAALPETARRTLLEPLCVAALNTPAAQASASVFLRVLRDALFGGTGAADLLLPRAPLSTLLPAPAADWLLGQGARLRAGQRVMRIERREGGSYSCDDEAFDAVILACSATEAGRLTAELAPQWSAVASGFAYEPIVTVYLGAAGAAWDPPMIALDAGPDDPAQFAFDLGALDPTRNGVYAFVVSGARDWIERGLDATAQAVLAQAGAAFASMRWRVLQARSERRATFACTPGLQRPAARLASGLVAAGDYIEGPYPATLEGAVASGCTAVRLLGAV